MRIVRFASAVGMLLAFGAPIGIHAQSQSSERIVRRGPARSVSLIISRSINRVDGPGAHLPCVSVLNSP